MPEEMTREYTVRCTHPEWNEDGEEWCAEKLTLQEAKEHVADLLKEGATWAYILVTYKVFKRTTSDVEHRQSAQELFSE